MEERVSSNSVKKDLFDRLTCGLCTERYNEGKHVPKLVSCGHTLCSDCLRHLVTKTYTSKTFPCPFCREKIPVMSMSRYKNNMALVGMLDLLPQEQEVGEVIAPSPVLHICPKHHGNVAHYRCITCDVALCGSCLKAELSTPQHPGHTIDDMPLDQKHQENDSTQDKDDSQDPSTVITSKNSGPVETAIEVTEGAFEELGAVGGEGISYAGIAYDNEDEDLKRKKRKQEIVNITVTGEVKKAAGDIKKAFREQKNDIKDTIVQIFRDIKGEFSSNNTDKQ